MIAAEQEDPMQRLQYYRETGQVAQAKEYEQYLRETGQYRTPAPGVRPDASSVTPRADKGGDLQAMLSGGQGRVLTNDVLPGVAAHVLNAVPIPNRVLALAGMASGMGYGESRAALDEGIDQIPSDMRVAEQLVGAPELLPAAKATALAAKRAWPVIKAVAKEAVPNRVQKMMRAGKRVMSAAEKVKAEPRALPEPNPVRGAIAPKPQTLEELIGPMEMLPDEAATLEQRIGDVVRNASPFKQRGATKGQLAWRAEQHAQRTARPVPEAMESVEPTLEDLLGLSNQQRAQGVPMQTLNETRAKILGNRPR